NFPNVRPEEICAILRSEGGANPTMRLPLQWKRPGGQVLLQDEHRSHGLVPRRTKAIHIEASGELARIQRDLVHAAALDRVDERRNTAAENIKHVEGDMVRGLEREANGGRR